MVDRKDDELKIRTIPISNEGKSSVRYGCIKFIDSYRFLSEFR